MTKLQLGVISLAVMGTSLSFNIDSCGYSVSVYTRSPEKTEQMLKESDDTNIVATYSIEELVNSLEKPRKILLMVQAGPATDGVIESLLPHLDKDDILIDGGNTNFRDTQRRS